MQRMLRYFTCAIILCTATSGALAQITMDTADVARIFKVGNVLFNNSDTLTTTADIGAPGLTSWDFSGLKTTSFMRMVSVNPRTSTYASQFPTATHAVRDTAFTYSFYYADLSTTVILKGTGFEYFTLGTDLQDHGLIGAGTAYMLGGSFPANGSWLRSPAAIYYGLPLTMPGGWSTTYDETLSGKADFLGGLPIGPSVTKHTVTYTVDAYGPLTLPGPKTQQALRLYKIDRFTGATNGVHKGYVLLARNGASVQVTLTDTLASSSGTVGVTAVVWMPPTVEVPDYTPLSETPTAFGLEQNYPNPFNPSTQIGFAVSGPGSSWVRLGVYDMLGREVALLVDEQKPAGAYRVQFDGRGLSTGIYHYRLTATGDAGTFVETKSMVLVK